MLRDPNGSKSLGWLCKPLPAVHHKAAHVRSKVTPRDLTPMEGTLG